MKEIGDFKIKMLAGVLGYWFGWNGTSAQYIAVALFRSGPEFADAARIFRRVARQLDIWNWGRPMQPEIPDLG